MTQLFLSAEFIVLNKNLRRFQPGSATLACGAVNASLGVFQPRHFLGRLLSFSYTSQICSSIILLKSVRLRKKLAHRVVGTFIEASFPGMVGMDKATSGLQDFIDELVHGKFFAVVEGEGGLRFDRAPRRLS